MAIQLSFNVRNARVNQILTTIGQTAVLILYSGAMPANCASAATGSTLVVMTSLPGAWMSGAVNGSASFSGTWQGTASGGGTTSGYFRLWTNGQGTTGMQGTVGTTGGPDLTLDNNLINVGQLVTIASWVITDGNA
jgi:hypothetical protein